MFLNIVLVQEVLFLISSYVLQISWRNFTLTLPCVMGIGKKFYIALRGLARQYLYRTEILEKSNVSAHEVEQYYNEHKAEFSEVAKRYSEDKFAQDGGYMGYVIEPSSAHFDINLKKLAAGEFSSPIAPTQWLYDH